MVANAELFKALVKAQAEVENAAKGSTNPHLKNRYADLGAVLEVAKPVLKSNGLAVVTLPCSSDLGADAKFTTTVYHVSGESVTWDFTIPYGAKRDPQGLGGLLTYARRYCLSAWLNMWAEDDDGETAVGRPPAKQASPAKPSPAAPPARGHKELIESLANAPTKAALDSLLPECLTYRGTEHWSSIEAVAKARKDAILSEGK